MEQVRSDSISKNNDKGFSVIDAIDQSIIVTDSNGVIQNWNKGAEELYKWHREEVIGKYIGEITVPKISLKQGESIMNLLKQGKKWKGSFLVQDKLGNEFEVYVIDSPIFENGELIGIVGISSDISSLLNEREDLVIERLTMVMEENLSKLIGNLTHNLNNQLMVARGNLSIIRSKIDKIKKDELLDLLANTMLSIDHMTQGIKHIQVITRKKSFFTERVNISRLLFEMQIMFESINFIPVTLDLDENTPPIIIDFSVIERLIVNLMMLNPDLPDDFEISEPIKIQTRSEHISSMEKGNRIFPIDQQIEPGEYVFLNIILPEITYKLIDESFDQPFLNHDRATQLIINSIRGICTAYQGNVVLESKNKRLSFLFPIVNDIQEVSYEYKQKRKIKPGSKILIAEDNPLIQKTLIRMLEPLNLNITVANNGYEVVKLLKLDPDFSFLLLDLKMPKMDGILVAQYIKEHEIDIPFLIISGHHDDTGKIFELFDPVPPILSKPFSPEQLLDKVKQLVEMV